MPKQTLNGIAPGVPRSWRVDPKDGEDSEFPKLTSTSVWVNLPAAAFLVVLVRYFSMDFEMRRKAAVYNSRSNSGDVPIQEKPIDIPKPAIKKDQWKKKIKSPVVED
ncbi:hypothetical protein KSS87_013094, partial [Heliosperma pusillum]